MAITEAETQDLLSRARLALQQGDKEKARDLLTKLLEQDDRNAKAWLLLSGAVDAVEEQRICLENVLTLEPENTAARQGLEFLNKLYPPEPAPAPVAPPPPPIASTPALNGNSQYAAAPAPPQFPAPAAPVAPPIASPFSTSSLGDEHEPLQFPGLSASVDSMAPWPQFGENSNVLPWDGNDTLESGESSAPAPIFLPDDPWAELRANMSAPSTGVTPPAPSWTPTELPASNGAYAAAPLELPALPSWAANLPGDPETPTDLGFGDTPLENLSPAESFGFSGSGGNSNPLAALPELPPPGASTDAGLPDWAVALDSGASSSAVATPAWTMPSEPAPPPAAPSIAPPAPFGSAVTPAPFGSAAAPFDDTSSSYGNSTPLFGSATPVFGGDPSAELGSNELPPDSPWASTFGGGLGAGPISTPVEDTSGQQFGDPGGSPFGLGDPLRGSSPSIISRPPLSGRAAGAAPGFPCPNCGELATGNALSCARCQFRFYANCPKCGEYLDTTDISPTDDDTCPRCGEHIDKLKLGRNENSTRTQTPRESAVAQIATTRPASEHAATQSLTKARQQSTARTLVGVLVVLALIVFLLFVLPNIMEANGVQLQAPDLNNIFPTPAP